MSKRNLRKRKEQPEDLSKFISAKRRRIDLEDDSEDANYGSPVSYRRLRRKSGNLTPEGKSDEIVLYDEEDNKEKEEKDHPSESVGRSESFEDEDGESIDSWSGLEEEYSGESSDGGLFNPKDHIYERFVIQTKKEAKKKLNVINREDLERVDSKEEANRLAALAEDTQKKLQDEEPDIVKILSTPMTEKERKKMIQFYEIYMSTTEGTEDHYEWRCRLISMMKDYARTDVREQERVETEVERITSTIPKSGVWEIKKRIINLDADDVVKARLLEMHRELEETPPDSGTYHNLKEKLEWGVSLPYRKVSAADVPKSPDHINPYCVKLRETLDSEIYGMDEVKEEMVGLRVNQLTNPGAASTLALEGPPGVGKTAICEAFARAVGKPFERAALGGMKDSDIFKGSGNQYIGASPSIILSFLRNMKIADGYVLLDEIDKIGDTREGQAVQSALLHITDYTQNKEFRDSYLSEFPHDISKICFMYGMNDRNKIDPILRDRLTIIEVEAYTTTEIKEIIKGYIFPKALRRSGLTHEECTIDDSGCDAVIGMVADHIKDTGVRKVDEAVKKIATRVNLLRMVTLGDGTLGTLKLKYKVPNFKMPFVIDRNAVKQLLSPPKNKTPNYII